MNKNCIYNLTKLESLSDHCIMGWTIKKIPSQSVKIEKQSRNLKNINTVQFKIDLKNKLEIMQQNVSTEEMYGNYINDITSITEKHAPITRRKLTKKQHELWFDEEALKLKIQRRKAEKIGKKVKVRYTKKQYQMADKCYKHHLHHTKKEISQVSIKLCKKQDKNPLQNN